MIAKKKRAQIIQFSYWMAMTTHYIYKKNLIILFYADGFFLNFVKKEEIYRIANGIKKQKKTHTQYTLNMNSEISIHQLGQEPPRVQCESTNQQNG